MWSLGRHNAQSVDVSSGGAFMVPSVLNNEWTDLPWTRFGAKYDISD